MFIKNYETIELQFYNFLGGSIIVQKQRPEYLFILERPLIPNFLVLNEGGMSLFSSGRINQDCENGIGPFTLLKANFQYTLHR